MMSVIHRGICLRGVALVATLYVSHGAFAQEDDSRITIEKVVGDSTVAISYPRADVGGKKVWGKRLRYGANWFDDFRSKVTVTFEEDVDLNGVRLLTGTYGFYVRLVNEDDWQLVINKNASPALLRYSVDDDLIQIAVRPEDARLQDTLTFGIENIEEDDEAHIAEFSVHWEKKKAVLRLRMTGERRGKGLRPIVSPEAKDAWSIVRTSIRALIGENFLVHIRDFAEDFETEFGDGGSAAAHMQLLTNLSRGGLTEGMGMNFENLEYEVDGNDAVFKNMVVYSLLGTLDFTYELEKRDGNWRITTLFTD